MRMNTCYNLQSKFYGEHGMLEFDFKNPPHLCPVYVLFLGGGDSIQIHMTEGLLRKANWYFHYYNHCKHFIAYKYYTQNDNEIYILDFVFEVNYSFPLRCRFWGCSIYSEFVNLDPEKKMPKFYRQQALIFIVKRIRKWWPIYIYRVIYSQENLFAFTCVFRSSTVTYSVPGCTLAMWALQHTPHA